MVACGGKEPIDPTPPTPPTPTIDTKAPVISVSLSSVNVIGGQEVTLGTSELKIGTKTVATWKDDVSKTCKAGLELDGKAISSGTKLSDPGKLKLTVTDEAGNSSSTEITLTKNDSQAPEIEVKIAEKNVIAGVKIKIEGNQLLFDSEVAASWIDDYSESCKVEITMVPEEGESKAVNSGDVIKEAGKLVILAQDDFENKSSAEIALTKTDSQAPTIEVKIPEKNVIAGVKVKVEGNQLYFDKQEAATWKDDYSETCTVDLSIAGEKINSGDILFDAGTMVISVADEFQNKATAEITLTAVAITGLENMQNLSLQVDQEVNLLEGLTFAEGLTLQKVEMVQGNDHIQIENPRAFKPEYSGSIDIIFTLSRFDGSTIEVGVNNLTIKALDYSKVSIPDMNPYDILPLYGIGRIEDGDYDVYNYIDNLRIAEAMRIRKMMGKYGAGDYNPEQYMQLMERLHYVMNQEVPDSDKYNNFEWI